MADLYAQAAAIEAQMNNGGDGGGVSETTPRQTQFERLADQAREQNARYQQAANSVSQGAAQVGQIIANSMQEDSDQRQQRQRDDADAQAERDAEQDSADRPADGLANNSSANGAAAGYNPGVSQVTFQPGGRSSTTPANGPLGPGVSVITFPARQPDPPLDAVAAGVLDDANLNLGVEQSPSGSTPANLWDDPSLADVTKPDPPPVSLAASDASNFDLAAVVAEDPATLASRAAAFVRSEEADHQPQIQEATTVEHAVVQQLSDQIVSQLNAGGPIDLRAAAAAAVPDVIYKTGNQAIASVLNVIVDAAPDGSRTAYLSSKVVCRFATAIVNRQGAVDAVDELLRKEAVHPMLNVTGTADTDAGQYPPP